MKRKPVKQKKKPCKKPPPIRGEIVSYDPMVFAMVYITAGKRQPPFGGVGPEMRSPVG